MEDKWDLLGKYERTLKTFTLLTVVLWVWTVYYTSPEVLQTYVTQMNKCEKTGEKHCFSGENNEVWRAVVPFINDLNSCLHSKVVFFSDQQFEFSAEIEVRHRFLLIQKYNISQTVGCLGSVCEETDLVYIPYIRYSNYSIEVKNKMPVLSDNVEIRLFYVNSRYSVYAMLVSICLIWIEAMLLITNSSNAGSNEYYICALFWVSLIFFNLGVIFQFLLSFNTQCGYLAGWLKIQYFFVAFMLWGVKFSLALEFKFVKLINFVAVCLVGWLCWVQLDVYFSISGQESYIEILRGKWVESPEIKEKLDLITDILKVLLVWILISTAILLKTSENPDKNLYISIFTDLFYQLSLTLSTYLKLFFPTSPLNPLYFSFPLLFTVYPYLLQTQENKSLYTSIPKSLKSFESKLD